MKALGYYTTLELDTKKHWNTYLMSGFIFIHTGNDRPDEILSGSVIFVAILYDCALGYFCEVNT